MKALALGATVLFAVIMVVYNQHEQQQQQERNLATDDNWFNAIQIIKIASPHTTRKKRPMPPLTKEQCKSHPGPSSRATNEQYLCNSNVEIPAPSSVMAEEDIPINLHNRTNHILLDGGDWGKLCNKMSIITGLLLHLRRNSKLDNAVIALNPYFSAVLWALDFERASQLTGAFLMDCSYCGESSSKQKWDTYRCLHAIVKGRVYNASNHMFVKNQTMWVGQMYWGFRFDDLGYDAELMNALKPKPFLEPIIQEYFDSRRAEGVQTVAMHRRWIEGLCYEFNSDLREYMCAGNSANHLVNPYKQLLKSKENKAYYESTNKFRTMDDLHRKQFEKQVEVLVTCNFTLDEEQFPLINKSWPVAFSKPFDVYLATDGQTPYGDRAVEQSPFPRKVHRLEEMQSPTCFADKKFQDMLTEMLAMSMTDFHMELPTSSCSRFVLEWRRARGKQRGSMYPPVCFNGFQT